MIEDFNKSTKYILDLIDLKDINISTEEYNKINEIEKIAIEDGIPIITKEVLKYLLFMLDILGSKNVLEIGTATGYSSIYISKNLEKRNGKLTTIEIDPKRYTKAVSNFINMNLHNIKHINDDAINYLENTNEKFDFIFIDARKSIYIDFVEKSKKHLSKNGIIFIDNTLFRSFVGTDLEIPKKYKNMVDKMNSFVPYIMEKYKACVLPFGDGVALIKCEDMEV